MRATAIGLLVAACGPAATATPPIANRAAAEPPGRLVSRRMSIHSRVGAILGISELTIDGSRATLFHTVQNAPVFTIEQADREASWTITDTSTKTGPVNVVGDHLVLYLDEGASVLHCWHRTLVVGTAGARRVPTPGHRGDCSDPGVWSPAATTRVDALTCGSGGSIESAQNSGLDDISAFDEGLWLFVAPPGLELVDVSEDCFQSKGLRLAK